MKVYVVNSDESSSNRVRRRGIRAVARAANMDCAYLSRIVNDKVAITETTYKRIILACNKVKPSLKLWQTYYDKPKKSI